MAFRYVFRDLDENLITTLDTDQPLAHLAIGNNIVLKTAEYSPAKETWHRVEYVMVVRG